MSAVYIATDRRDREQTDRSAGFPRRGSTHARLELLELHSTMHGQFRYGKQLGASDVRAAWKGTQNDWFAVLHVLWKGCPTVPWLWLTMWSG